MKLRNLFLISCLALLSLTVVASPAFGWVITTIPGANGTIAPANPDVPNGANQAFTITPNANYRLVSLTVDGIPVTPVIPAGMIYMFTNVTAVHTIAATFVINTYNITATVTGGGGSVTPAGVTTVNDGATPTYTITPHADYSISDVVVDGVSQGAVGTYTFAAVHANHTIAAIFIIPATTHNFTTQPVTATRISANSTGVRLLSWTVTSGNMLADSLKQVTMTSYIERAYAGKQYSLLAWDNTDSTRHLLETISTQNIKFETNDKLAFTDCLWATQPQTIDTFYILMDANTNYIKVLADVFDTTGVKIKVLTGDVLYRSDPDGDGALPAVAFSNAATIENSGVCISRIAGTVPCFEIEFDTKIPVCSLLVFSDSRDWYGAGAVNLWDGCRPSTISLGDTIAFRMADTTCFSHYNPAGMTFEEQVFQARNFPKTDSFLIDMSHYATGTTTPVYFKFLRPWRLKYAIPDSVLAGFPSGVRDPIDTLPGLKVYASFRDSTQNWGQYVTAWPVPVDTKRPVVDSKALADTWNVSGQSTTDDTVAAVGDSLLKFFISRNNTGPDSSAALGDRLSLIAYLGSNGYQEIASVTADLTNFRPDSAIWPLRDVSGGSNVWRADFFLTQHMPVDVPSGYSLQKLVILTIVDKACNVTLDSAVLQNALDLQAPNFGSVQYFSGSDFDQNYVLNLGDSVMVKADMSVNNDIDSVWADFKNAGVGGSMRQPLLDDGSNNDSIAGDHVWTKGWRIGKSMDPAFDPNPLDAKDADSYPPDGDFTVTVLARDEAGNTDSIRSNVLRMWPGGPAMAMDTRRPAEIIPNSVQVLHLPGDKLQLKWPRSTQAEDALYFFVFADSTGGGFDFTMIFDSTFDQDYAPDTNAWTSERLSNSKTYGFVIRTMDDGGNWDVNTTIHGDISQFCGDCDGSGKVDISDAVYLVPYIFEGTHPPLDVSRGDVDCSGQTDLSDVVYLIKRVFGDGPAPCQGPLCGKSK